MSTAVTVPDCQGNQCWFGWESSKLFYVMEGLAVKTHLCINQDNQSWDVPYCPRPIEVRAEIHLRAVHNYGCIPIVKETKVTATEREMARAVLAGDKVAAMMLADKLLSDGEYIPSSF